MVVYLRVRRARHIRICDWIFQWGEGKAVPFISTIGTVNDVVAYRILIHMCFVNISAKYLALRSTSIFILALK